MVFYGAFDGVLWWLCDVVAFLSGLTFFCGLMITGFIGCLTGLLWSHQPCDAHITSGCSLNVSIFCSFTPFYGSDKFVFAHSL